MREHARPPGGAGEACCEDDDGPRAVPRRRPWFSPVTAVAMVALAAAVAGLAGWMWAGDQEANRQVAFRGTASSIAEAIGSEVQRDLDLSVSFGELVASQQGSLTNKQLAAYLGPLQLARRYPGTLGISFYVEVPQSRLASYEAAMAADPEVGAAGSFAVFPGGPRPSYCLPRWGMVVGQVNFPSGLDICAPTYPGIGPSPLPLLVRLATRTGHPVVFGFDSLTLRRNSSAEYRALFAHYRNRFLVVTPVFSSGVATGSVAAREAHIAGWVVQTFGNAALDAAVEGNPGYSVAVSAAAGRVVQLGASPARARVTTTVDRVSSAGLAVKVSAPATLAPQAEGAVLGGVAFVLFGLVVAFVLHLRRSRRRALDLVELRTGELRHQALHDGLTGLPNRTLLFDRADQMLARNRRRQATIGALYVDLDNFKQVNDTFGHQIGDQLLVAVAQRLRSALRASDTVGRLGGDEFLVLTEDDEEEAGPEAVAARLVTVLGEHFDMPGTQTGTLTVTASIGVAVGARDSARDLIRDADVALYQAKAAGRNRAAVFQKAVQTTIHDGLILEMELREALGTGQLSVAYQPIVRLDDLAPIGVEALVRWNHPVRGPIPPNEFIPVAERSALIVDIGRFVLETACRQAAAWRARGIDLRLSVNVSAVQLDEPAFLADLRQIVQATGIEPSRLTLELTESVLMRDTPRGTRMLLDLRAMGMRIAIDDFGTGYSSLAYLRQLPIDSVKIDRSFVDRHGREDHWQAFIHTVIQLGKTLGIETLAEGIEDRDQLARLQAEHCDSGQGFLFARPMAAATVPAALAGLGMRATPIPEPAAPGGR